MTDRNLAIVWAPNLLRSPALEAGGVAALRGVGVQAVVTGMRSDRYSERISCANNQLNSIIFTISFIQTEYLITNCHTIFDASEEFESKLETSGCATIDEAEEAQAMTRDHDLSVAIPTERPKSLGVSGARLISLEEAQNRHNRIEFIDLNKTNPINTPGGSSSYIEVGGGPSR